MIKIFTIEGWYEIPDAMVMDMSGIKKYFTLSYFITILLSGGIFGLSIINATLVDAMTMDNNDEIDKKIDRLEEKN